jgi:hypothetical protein
MSRVEEIQQAIATLTLEERAELLSSLMNFEDDEWDKQMKRDAAAGKFDAMSARTQADIKAGRTKSLDEVIGEA